MRKPLAAALVGAGLLSLTLPAAPASASCDPLFYAVTGRCGNACGVVARAYLTAYETAPHVVPYVEILCPA